MKSTMFVFHLMLTHRPSSMVAEKKNIFQKTQLFWGLLNILTCFNFITQQKGALL